jgi:magnesium-dependent phosphatase 1
MDDGCGWWFIFSVHALREIEELRRSGHDIHAAVASRTDEPRWARTCMQHLIIDDVNDTDSKPTTLQDCFGGLVEISYGSKVKHLERLQKTTGVRFSEMSFFDNENWNIQDVSRSLPDVKCYYTPNGMTREAWEQAKRDFGMA